MGMFFRSWKILIYGFSWVSEKFREFIWWFLILASFQFISLVSLWSRRKLLTLNSSITCHLVNFVFIVLLQPFFVAEQFKVDFQNFFDEL